MDIFDAPANSMLVHACNCMGVWGSGIARLFKEKFPKTHEHYKNFCQSRSDLLGTATFWDEGKYAVGCLFTSYSFGEDKDDEAKILEATKTALVDLFELAKIFNRTEIYSNSGLFGVPWHKTESILVEMSERYPEISWTVCDWP